MRKFGSSGWARRRRLVLVLVIQLVVVASVLSLILRLPTGSSRWSGQNAFDAGVDDWAASRRAGKSDGGGLGTRDLHELSGTVVLPDQQQVRQLRPGEVFRTIPFSNEMSRRLEARNHELPRNRELFPNLAEDHITIVLYVHNRPHYLKLVVKSLSEVEGIGETLLIVSHDGFFPEMNSVIEGIRFCQVKQIFATFSPHLLPESFPGQGPADCKGSQSTEEVDCTGNADQYGNHRSPRIVSLKHHWWWMMNTVWDGLEETRNRDGHVVFIEEDHYILPNAYRAVQQLSRMVGSKCPECVAVNLAPVDVASRGEGFQYLVAEKIGNVGYAFNRTVWNWIHSRAEEFCKFDDYNWDITMWAVVYPSFPTQGYTLRGPKTSAIHFGKCGLHQGQDKNSGVVCADDNMDQFQGVSALDTAPFLNATWRVSKYGMHGYKQGFEGWGGWGDKRDQQLCVNFSKMYHRSSAIS